MMRYAATWMRWVLAGLRANEVSKLVLCDCWGYVIALVG